jgi:hypothetical protein
MGIRTDIYSNEGTVFSEDVLKIEICGPDEDYLTVIDVPGIFRNPTEGSYHQGRHSACAKHGQEVHRK